MDQGSWGFRLEAVALFFHPLSFHYEHKQDAPARCGLDLHFLASRSKKLRFWYLQQLCVPGTDLHYTQPSMVMRVRGPVPAVSSPHRQRWGCAGYRLARGSLVRGSLQVPGQHCALLWSQGLTVL